MNEKQLAAAIILQAISDAASTLPITAKNTDVKKHALMIREEALMFLKGKSVAWDNAMGYWCDAAEVDKNELRKKLSATDWWDESDNYYKRDVQRINSQHRNRLKRFTGI